MKICCRTTSEFCSVLALRPHSECSPGKLQGAATFSLSMRSAAPNPAALVCFPQTEGPEGPGERLLPGELGDTENHESPNSRPHFISSCFIPYNK